MCRMLLPRCFVKVMNPCNNKRHYVVHFLVNSLNRTTSSPRNSSLYMCRMLSTRYFVTSLNLRNQKGIMSFIFLLKEGVKKLLIIKVEFSMEP